MGTYDDGSDLMPDHDDENDGFADKDKGSSLKILSVDDTAAEEVADTSGCCGKLRSYPVAIWFIIGNEFCERFSYYGMRAVLVLYLVHFLDFGDDKATVVYHVFVMLSYLMCVFGGILADSKLGKFRTIFILSIVYVCGNIVMSVTAIPGVTGSPPSSAGMWCALLLLAAGAGGIKPCVSSFGGDQFSASQAYLIPAYFSVFYFAINSGAVTSMLITPTLRSRSCFGNAECFPLAYGVPAVLMIIALFVFLFGRRYYQEKIPTRNVMLDAFRAYRIGIRHRWSAWRAGRAQPTYWLDPAANQYGPQFIADLKRFHRILILFIPTPCFWALFDQQGSRWTLQAEEMKMFNMGVLGRFRPDQMQAVNSILVLMLIPVFERVIYPLLGKVGMLKSSLTRMGTGMVLCGAAFIISALVQTKIDNAIVLPTANVGFAQVRYLNILQGTIINFNELSPSNITVPSQSFSEYEMFSVDAEVNMTFTARATEEDSGLRASAKVQLREQSIYTVVVSSSGQTQNLSLFGTEQVFIKKREEKQNKARIQIINTLDMELVARSSGDEDDDFHPAVAAQSASLFREGLLESGAKDVILYVAGKDVEDEVELLRVPVDTEDGAFYTIVLWNNTGTLQAFLHQDVEGNQVSVLWQLPQYLVITCGEILFSVVGMEFAYSQAPASLKAMASAAWQLSTAVGSLIVIVVAESAIIPDQALEFYFFAGLMGGVTIIFAFFAYRYAKDSNNSNSNNKSGTYSPDGPGRGSPVSPIIDDSAPLLAGVVTESTDV